MTTQCLTPNQIIAYNLRRARFERGLTQEEATALLSPYLGVKWSKAVYSAAERSAERPGRIRRFSADDLMAFAAAFDLPVAFFMAPKADFDVRLRGAHIGYDQAFRLVQPKGVDTESLRKLDEIRRIVSVS